MGGEIGVDHRGHGGRRIGRLAHERGAFRTTLGDLRASHGDRGLPKRSELLPTLNHAQLSADMRNWAFSAATARRCDGKKSKLVSETELEARSRTSSVTEGEKMRKRCEACGIPFDAKTSRAKYCSGRCRQRAHRGQASPPLTIVELSDDDRAYIEGQAIMQTCWAMEDLCRAADIAPAPRCIVYREMAETIADGLGKVLP